MPWVNVDFGDAERIASDFEDREDVKSHLPFGCEYDSVLAWFIQSGTRTLEDIAEDSTDWGNYRNTENFPQKVVETRSNEQWCTNKIYDFTGNVGEWTQEKSGSFYRVIRGGNFVDNGSNYPAAFRRFQSPNNCSDGTGFRVTLYIK